MRRTSILTSCLFLLTALAGLTARSQTHAYVEVVLTRVGGLAPISGATVYLVPVAYIYPNNRVELTAHTVRVGTYYANAVEAGVYDVWVNQAKYNPPGASVVDGYVKWRDSLTVPGTSVEVTYNRVGLDGDGVTTVLNEDSTISVHDDLVANAVDSTRFLRDQIVNVRDARWGVVGDGSTDDATALAAVVAAVPAGSQVYIPGGMTVKIVGDLTIDKSLTLVLDNARILTTTGSLIIDADSVTVKGTNKFKSIIQQADTTDPAIVVVAGSDYVTIENVTIRGASREWYLELPRDESNGIQFQGDAATYSRHMTVQNCYFSRNVIDILVQYGVGGKFALNTFEALHTQSIQLNLWQTSYIEVIGNHFTALGAASAVGAIEFIGNDTVTTGNVISGNVVRGAYSYEVFNLFNLNGSSVQGNTIDAWDLGGAGAIALVTSGTEQPASNNTIGSNVITVRSGSGSGITLSKCTSCGDATTYVTDNIVTGNTITVRGNVYAITVGDSCHRNSVVGNKIYAAVTGTSDAIYIGKARNVDIIANTIRSSVTDSLRYGLYLNGTESATVLGNTFRHTKEAIIAGTSGTMALTLAYNTFDSVVTTTFYGASGTVNLAAHTNQLLGGSPAFVLGNALYSRVIPSQLLTSPLVAGGGITDTGSVIIYGPNGHIMLMQDGGEMSWRGEPNSMWRAAYNDVYDGNHLTFGNYNGSAWADRVTFENDGDMKLSASGKGAILTNAAGTVTKRVRLNDAGDGLIFEDP